MSVKEQLLASIQNLPDNATWEDAEERIRYMQNLNLELGVQQNSLSFDQIADMSLARDAVKLLG